MINQANQGQLATENAQKVVDTSTTFNYYKFRSHVIGYMFLLPALLIFALVSWYPIVLTVINSFQRIKLVGGSTWVGLSNYNRMFHDTTFVKAWENIGAFVVLSIVLGFMVPVTLSIIL